jgi:hypothetical protein
MDQTEIYRAFHPTAAENTFFSSAHGTFSSTDHMIAHKVSLNKFKRNDAILSIFSDNSKIKLEISNTKKSSEIIRKHRN